MAEAWDSKGVEETHMYTRTYGDPTDDLLGGETVEETGQEPLLHDETAAHEHVHGIQSGGKMWVILCARQLVMGIPQSFPVKVS